MDRFLKGKEFKLIKFYEIVCLLADPFLYHKTEKIE